MSARKNQQLGTYLLKDATYAVRALAIIFVISIIIRPVIVGTG